MKITCFHSLLALVLLTLIAGGCTTAPARFYTLNVTATAKDVPAANYAVVVGPISLPAEVNREPMTLQVTPNRLEVEEFNRWSGPLDENIARVIVENLAAQLGTPRVATTHLANFHPDYHVTIDFEQFASVRDASTKADTAVIEAVWAIRRSADGKLTSGRTTVSEPAPGSSFDALAAAHSRALAKVSGDIAAAILSEAREKPEK
jgi:uncharacterized lipoprotein YmbA